MPAKPRGERGWWLEKHEGEWYVATRDTQGGVYRYPKVGRYAIGVLWRLARLQRRRVERMREYLEDCCPCVLGCPFCKDKACESKHPHGQCVSWRRWKEAMA